MATPELSNFIRQIIEDDLKTGKFKGRVVTRFPPEPNGYLHVGHAKSICLNFGVARDYKAPCHLRFDDTNPSKEETEYVEAIKADVRWLGFEWSGPVRHASDYFEELYQHAETLVRKGKAYVCELSPADMRSYRGTLTEPGKPSPWRERSPEENLDLLRRMRAGEFDEGRYTLRAKIDMSSGNINMRDPAIYRIMKKEHHATGDKWCIYPMYDFTHCLSDSIEGITHSLCTLEFADHRPLYDWFLDELECESHPQQIEFARLNLNYTVTSKRKLKELVDTKSVAGWDDPRLPTLVGMRRRGYPAEALRNFCERVGVAKKSSVIDMSILEEHVRDVLNNTADRAFCVLNPLEVEIRNVEDGFVQELRAPKHPQQPERGDKALHFAKTIYIDAEDFALEPVPGFQRLVLGGEVRLRHAYVLKCEDVEKDASGRVTKLYATIDKDTLGKNPEGRKVKGVIHYLAKGSCKTAQVNLYDRLFNVEEPGRDSGDYLKDLNPASLSVVTNALVESSICGAKPETGFQFERVGYFAVDADSTEAQPIFNRAVGLRDTWAKELAKR